MVLSKKRARHVIEEIIALFPDAKPSLDFRNHFELLVAVMLSAQTTDAAVNKATPGLFAAFPTPSSHAAASSCLRRTGPSAPQPRFGAGTAKNATAPSAYRSIL